MPVQIHTTKLGKRLNFLRTKMQMALTRSDLAECASIFRTINPSYLASDEWLRLSAELDRLHRVITNKK